MGTTAEKYMNLSEEYVLHTYNRFPVVLDHGKGLYLYDVEGKSYMDFASGIGVFALGYGNEEFNDALKAQIDKVIHTSNLYYNVPMGEAAKQLAESCGMSKVFFTNSGTEAIEGAIKVARKYAYLRDNSNDHEIIAMHSSFHGRSLGALSVPVVFLFSLSLFPPFSTEDSCIVIIALLVLKRNILFL